MDRERTVWLATAGRSLDESCCDQQGRLLSGSQWQEGRRGAGCRTKRGQMQLFQVSYSDKKPPRIPRKRGEWRHLNTDEPAACLSGANRDDGESSLDE